MNRSRSSVCDLLMTMALAILCGLLVVGSMPVQAAGTRVPVPSVTLYPGDALSEDVLSSRRFRSSYVSRRPVARSVEQVVGKVARRTLLRGKPIALNALRDPYLVLKGHPVRVVYATAGLTIITYATSLKSGGYGEVIRARNVDSGKIISGVIQSDGSLHVRRP